MKRILLFGAGKSATVLIDYLVSHSRSQNWMVTVVDADLLLAQGKIGNAPGCMAVSFDISDEKRRQAEIETADIVISLLPPALHFLVAGDCLTYKKNLLTASYVDEQMKSMQPDIEKAGLLFLCEMGLDPGIDHMSAKKMIDDIQEGGGKITSFLSHCGGLVAPESDDNPWHYKVSWNPKNIVMAGKSGAVFKQNQQVVTMNYEQLFAQKRFVSINGNKPLCWYPNRDSVGYTSIYGLEDCPTFIRTTLRHPHFIYGWKNIIALKLTDETLAYQTSGKSLKDFFKEHLDKHGFANWLQQKMMEQFEFSRKILEDLAVWMGMEDEIQERGEEKAEEIMLVNDKGNLEELDLDQVKLNAAAAVADKMQEAKLLLKQLFFLGMDDSKTEINKGLCSAADVLQLVLEKKLALLPGDKDMVVMIHEIEFEKGGQSYKHTSSLVLHGENDHHTAMAKTVGLPLGIAAKLILDGTIDLKGLHIPVCKEIYEPVLKELAQNGIRFTDNQSTL